MSRLELPSRSALLLALGASAFGCASDASRPEPAVTLASGTGAQVTHRTLESAFFDADAAGRIALIPRLRQYLSDHAGDQRAASVRVFLAFGYLERGELASARTTLAPVLEGPRGATRDFARVASAAALSREGRTAQALAELERLDGRIVDLDERFVYGEEQTRAAFDSGERKRAMRALLAWLSQSPPDRLERARETARDLLGRAPARELAQALAELAQAPPATSNEREAARLWLTSTIAERLTRLALARVDADLAERVLNAAPAAFRATPDGQRLVALSSTAVEAPRVAGRALGLLLGVADSRERRRAAAVAAGVTRALGSVRGSGAQGVELVTRTGQDSLDDELAALAGEGAALLVAGVSDDSARAAAEFAERKRIPVLLLRRPAGFSEGGAFTFVLGADDAELERLLTEALTARGVTSVARVGPSGTSCAALGETPGKSRFPVGEWRSSGVGAVLALGDAACARDLARELGSGRPPLLPIALGFDASEAYGSLGVPALAPKAGRYPEGAPPGGWYEALGRDAAVLAARALSVLPIEGQARGESVDELHERARDALARAQAELWTSEAEGFGGARVLPRKLGVVSGGPKPER